MDTESTHSGYSYHSSRSGRSNRHGYVFRPSDSSIWPSHDTRLCPITCSLALSQRNLLRVRCFVLFFLFFFPAAIYVVMSVVTVRRPQVDCKLNEKFNWGMERGEDMWEIERDCGLRSSQPSDSNFFHLVRSEKWKIQVASCQILISALARWI